MLGLRHFRGVAIDLWLGDVSLFACDMLCPMAEWLQASDLAQTYRNVYDEAGAQGLRHLAVLHPTFQSHATSCVAEIALTQLRAFLDSGLRSSGFARVTFVLTDKAAYDAYQECLFLTFQDGEL